MESVVDEPGVWVVLLINVAGSIGLGNKRLDEVRMQIACDMAPLVNCMCDDVKRELFQSKQYWFGAIRPFVQLVYSLTESDNTVPVLMGYDRVRELMVQSLFWGVHRQDIIAEAEPFKEVMQPDAFAFIADYSGAALVRVLKSYEKEGENKFYFEGKGKELNISIGTTPITNRAYDPSCGSIFISGLVSLLKGDNTNDILTSPNFFNKKDTRTLVTLLTGKASRSSWCI